MEFHHSDWVQIVRNCWINLYREQSEKYSAMVTGAWYELYSSQHDKYFEHNRYDAMKTIFKTKKDSFVFLQWRSDTIGRIGGATTQVVSKSGGVI